MCGPWASPIQPCVPVPQSRLRLDLRPPQSGLQRGLPTHLELQGSANFTDGAGGAGRPSEHSSCLCSCTGETKCPQARKRMLVNQPFYTTVSLSRQKCPPGAGQTPLSCAFGQIPLFYRIFSRPSLIPVFIPWPQSTPCGRFFDLVEMGTRSCCFPVPAGHLEGTRGTQSPFIRPRVHPLISSGMATGVPLLLQMSRKLSPGCPRAHSLTGQVG